MNWAAECAVLIPCLNEAIGIQGLVEAVRVLASTVIVIDDGSTDETAGRAAQAGAEVLRRRVCGGKGAALADGWQHARERGFSWVLTMDGDGQHAPEDIPAFFTCADRTDARLVVGNRMGNAGQMPRVRRFVNHWMSARISRMAGQPFPDSQCGFRLMALDCLFQVPISARHYEVESDVLLAFARCGFKIEFVPVRVIYGKERSKITPVGDTIRWARWWWKWRKGVLPKRKKTGKGNENPHPGPLPSDGRGRMY
jgi:glycosyltransferase involved in cell wall biosynthesis